MTNKELVKKAKELATEYKTLYVMGCFGAPMSTKLGPKQGKYRYAENNSYNRSEPKHSQILKASEDTFGFDCVCMIKALAGWGWNGQKDKIYGGASYNTSVLGDYSANSILPRAGYDVSADFSKILPGEVLWMDGHVGLYVGNGEAVECTDRWLQKVMITTVGNISTEGKYVRRWTKHGKLKCIDYVEEDNEFEKVKEKNAKDVKKEPELELKYTVKAGDTLTKIAGLYGTSIDKILEDNKESHKRMTRSFICVGWVLKIRPGVK